jgi:O-antigen/teichoic acid export membrane protein
MTSETINASISGAEARRAARNAGAIAAASILSRGLQFGWQLILVPGLGPAAFGIYGAVSSFIQVGTSVASFGIGPIYIRDIARQPERAGNYLTATLFIQTILAFLAYLGVTAAAFLGGYDEAVRLFVALAGISLIIDTLGNMSNDLLLAREQMVKTSVVTIAHVVILITLAGIGLASGYGLVGVYLGVITAGIIRTTLLWLLVWLSGVRLSWPIDRSVALALLVNGVPLALSSFLGLLYQHVDKLVTSRLIGNTETGYLTLAFVIIFGVIDLLNTTLLTALYPLMSRSYGDGHNPIFGFMVEKLTFFTLLVCLPITLVLSLFAAQITIPLFGEQFAPTASVLSVLIWYALVAMTGNWMQQAMLAQNRQRTLLLIRVGGLALNIALLLILLPRLGVVGAAVSSICAESVVFSLYLFQFRAAGWDVRRLVPRAGRLAALGLLTALGMLALRGVQPALGIVVGLAVYTAGVFLARLLASDDWDLLYRLVAVMPGGNVVRKYWRRDVKLTW